MLSNPVETNRVRINIQNYHLSLRIVVAMPAVNDDAGCWLSTVVTWIVSCIRHFIQSDNWVQRVISQYRYVQLDSNDWSICQVSSLHPLQLLTTTEWLLEFCNDTWENLNIGATTWMNMMIGQVILTTQCTSLTVDWDWHWAETEITFAVYAAVPKTTQH